MISDLVTKEWKRQEEERLEREAAHREWLRKEEQRKKEEARREAIRRREQAITNSRNDLLSMVDDWARAIRIEAFFEAVTREAALVPEAGEGHGDSEGAEVLGRHLERARELLGGTDALARFRRWRTPEERLTP